jgi:L-iditol 2-dehydrogenase
VKRQTLGYDLDGGFAEHLLVPEAIVGIGHVIPVPDALPLDIAAITEPSACVLASLELCTVGAGSSVVIIGAGPMGMLHLLMARALGASPIIVSEPVEERRMLARQWGADVVLDPATDDLGAAVRAETGEGADAVIVSVGIGALVGPALEVVRPQGVINLFAGFPKGADPVPFDPNVVHYGEIVLTGSQNATTDQYRRTVRLLGSVPHVDEIVTHRFEIEQAPDAYAARLAMAGLKSLVVFPGVDAA